MNAVLAEPSDINSGRALALPLSPRTADLAPLLDGVVAGEQRAMERFYRLTIDKVFAAALRIVRCRATAEEVAEDVYVQIWHG